jgi:hypothetical protein
MKETSMDKAFWQNIIDNEYAVPIGYSVATLTSELREEIAYTTLGAGYIGTTIPMCNCGR